jgi:glutaredoxin
MPTYELFGTAGCQYTTELRDWLDLRRMDYVEYDVEADPSARHRLRTYAGAQRTVPVLVKDGAVMQVGWQGRGCAIGE